MQFSVQQVQNQTAITGLKNIMGTDQVQKVHKICIPNIEIALQLNYDLNCT